MSLKAADSASSRVRGAGFVMIDDPAENQPSLVEGACDLSDGASAEGQPSETWPGIEADVKALERLLR